jgi:hypothetical protein
VTVASDYEVLTYVVEVVCELVEARCRVEGWLGRLCSISLAFDNPTPGSVQVVPKQASFPGLTADLEPLTLKGYEEKVLML